MDALFIHHVGGIIHETPPRVAADELHGIFGEWNVNELYTPQKINMEHHGT